MRLPGALALATMLAAFAIARVHGVTPVPSSDGQFWDIQDTSSWAQDSGGIATGGRANPFNGFGYLKLQVRRGGGALVGDNRYLRGFGLHHDGHGRFDSITPQLVDGLLVSRGITTSAGTVYLRYFDSFTNTTSEARIVRIAWGGAVGAYTDGGSVAVAGTSSGDRRIGVTDTHVVVMQNAQAAPNPRLGPSGHGPSAHVLGNRTGVLTSVGDMYANPFDSTWPGFDPAHIGYVFTLRLRSGETRALVTFVVKGLSEVYDPRGGYPIPYRDALIGGEPVYDRPDARIPAAGSEIAKVDAVAAQLGRAPDLVGLTPLQQSRIANWNLPGVRTTGGVPGPPAFSVFEKAVGPMGRSVADIAMALDLVTGSDPEDLVTADAATKSKGPFAPGLANASLRGVRIGALRQRFVGFTGEREVVENMERVIRDLQAQGAVVVDVAIPDYDGRYAAIRGEAPGALRDAWAAYLSRGAQPGDRVLTLQDLLASGKLAPVSARRFQVALAPTPQGAALDAANARFIASRQSFRQLFVDLMDSQRLDALLFPANQARPHTHEGGQIRYGSEPGTCEESAATGLPQVTVPAGFLGGRYPVGISLLGRMWDDRRLLEIGAAYERATHHRRPPAGVQ